jgi:hypothetical protein
MPVQRQNETLHKHLWHTRQMHVHIVLGTAKAKPENKYPTDEEHAFIVFTLVDVAEASYQKAIDHLTKCGWHDVRCRSASPLDIEKLNGTVPTAQAACQDAVAGKVNAIILTDPVV